MSRPIAYTLTLTHEEFKTLQWMEARGYSGDLIKHAFECDGDETGIELRYRESDAWSVTDAIEEDSDAFGTCGTTDLVRKMYAFIDAIV